MKKMELDKYELKLGQYYLQSKQFGQMCELSVLQSLHVGYTVSVENVITSW